MAVLLHMTYLSIYGLIAFQNMASGEMYGESSSQFLGAPQAELCESIARCSGYITKHGSTWYRGMAQAPHHRVHTFEKLLFYLQFQ